MTPDYTQKAERDRIRSWVEKEYEVQGSYVEDLLDACDTLERQLNIAVDRITNMEKAWGDVSVQHLRDVERIARLEAALREIADADAATMSGQGYLDEWAEAESFNICRNRAHDALEGK